MKADYVTEIVNYRLGFLPKTIHFDARVIAADKTYFIFSPFSPPVVIRFFPLLYSLPPVIFGRLGIQIDHCSFSENLFTLG